MRIDSIEIKGLKSFELSGIDFIRINFTATLQNILGTNGSGKSNLMRQLTPDPAAREDYKANGYKRLNITHDGNTFCLSSDFTNKSSPHSFIMNGKELNVGSKGGTSGVQKELIKKHLGYTPVADSVCNVRYDLCSMAYGATSARMQLFISLNPKNIGFILDLHKKTRSRIKACKSNLARLAERKANIETSLLDQTVVEELRKESDTLSKETTQAIGHISTLTADLKRLSASSHLGVEDYTARIKALRRRVEHDLPFYALVNRGNPLDQLNEIRGKIAFLEGKRAPTEDRVVELTQELASYEEAVRDITEVEAISEIKLRITALQSEQADLKAKGTTDTPISASEITYAKDGLETLKSILEKFLDCQIKLIPSRRYQAKMTNLQYASMRSRTYDSERESLDQRIAYLRSQINLRESDIPKDTNCDVCPLWKQYKNTLDAIREELSHKEERLRKVNHLTRYLHAYLEGQDKQLQAFSYYRPYIDKLQDLIASHGEFRRFFVGKDIYAILRNNPLSFYHVISEYVARSENTLRIKETDTKLFQEELLLKKSANASTSERDRLINMVTIRKEKLKELKAELHGHDLEISNLRQTESDIEAYIKDLETVEEGAIRGEALLEKGREDTERKILELYLGFLERRQREMMDRLSQVNWQLRQQDILKGRYESEVVEQIEIIEKQKVEWENLEYSLSCLPHDYTVRFLNRIIRYCNACISRVFTYDFKINLVDAHSPLDYRLSVTESIDGVVATVPDIKLCSKSQKEMVNLSFNLALKKILGYSNYPIWLDETGDSFDATHRNTFLTFLKALLDEGLVSQMFMVNHNAIFHEGMTGGETLVLNRHNIEVPQCYNEHVEIQTADAVTITI